MTDTEYVKYRFKDLNHIIIEANYAKELLIETNPDAPVRNHVLTGHMELGTTLEFLKVNKTSSLRNVILAHLSEHNADPIKFFGEAREVVDCPVTVARKGLEIETDYHFKEKGGNTCYASRNS